MTLEYDHARHGNGSHAAPGAAAGEARGAADVFTAGASATLSGLPYAASPPPAPLGAPHLELPRGGGALRGLAESISAGPAGGAQLTVPLDLPPGRSGFGPALALQYSSIGGNGPWGLGWSIGLGGISLRTERGVPRHDGEDEVVIGADLLVRGRDSAGTVVESPRMLHGTPFVVTRFRPRIERAFARIERWRNSGDPTDVRWRVLDGSNITTWFGVDDESRIADPDDRRRIGTWLPSLSYDDRGNAIRYRYRPEDSVRVAATPSEANRTARQRGTNRYLSTVHYGNLTPYQPDLGTDGAPAPEPEDWAFTLACDYGDHGDPATGNEPDGNWPTRPDIFSSRRFGFEVRTYRRCHRLLVFHRFPELGHDPVLVTSTSFNYGGDDPQALSLLTSITRTGHCEDGSTATLPSLELSYTPWRIADAVETVEADEAVGAPIGIDGVTCEWVDLDGDGVPGMLSRTADGWFFQRNLSPLGDVQPGAVKPRVRFAAPEPLPDQPTGLPLTARSRAVLADVDGDGQADLLVADGPAPGAAVRRGAQWLPFAAFADAPGQADTTAFSSPTALVDLTGNGLPDVLVGDGQAARWYPGLGLDGFAAAQPVRLLAGADDQPETLLLHADRHRAVLLADMVGDGLVDLVEVTRTAVRYLPNLGHGTFGPPVVMDAAPALDTADGFDTARVLLADIDGAGAVGLIYLGGDGATMYRNRCGNSWSTPVPLPGTPGTDGLTTAAVVDLLGRGTGALVWSSGAPQPDGRAMHFLNLAAAGKPYLLSGYDNGFGTSVSCEFTPSTFFALSDRLAGRPWPTRLPFPVHCASRTVVSDAVRGTTFTTERDYHLGHYDGVERQFMGFGRVDTRDITDLTDGPADIPPILVRRWFSTGATAPAGAGSLHTNRHEYTDVSAPVTPEADPPAGLRPGEVRHAARALAGLELRAETFSLDGPGTMAVLYAASETSARLRLLQPAASGEAPVFQVLPAAETDYATERDADDPRVTQQLVLATDDLGCVTLSATVIHPRRVTQSGIPAEVVTAQRKLTVTCTAVDHTADVPGADVHRLRTAFRTRTFELTGVTVPDGTAAVADDLHTAFTSATDIGPDDAPLATGFARRLVGHVETRFLAGDLSGPLQAGQQAAHGLADRGYRLTLTRAMAADRIGTLMSDADLEAAGYVHLDGDDNWWAPSGRAVYPPDAADHFLLPASFRDALGVPTTLERRHHLVITAAVNALGHRIEADYDFRTLRIRQLTDVNGNRTAARFDPLGAVTATAIMGKAGAGEGDTLDDPTVAYSYDLHRWRAQGLPAVVRELAREQFGTANPRFQERRIYFDGAGAPVMTKAQARPGPAGHWDKSAGTLTTVDTTPAPRWIGSGRTLLNNKGLPIRRYEPFFSDTGEFESADAMVAAGVADTLFYDPLGRPERVERADGSLARLERGAWQIRAFDEIDTVADSRWYAERGSPDPSDPEPADPQTRAAWLAAAHAETPSRTHFDPLGRVVLEVQDCGGGELRTTRFATDLTGLRTQIFDNRDRLVAASDADLLGRVLVTDCAERGRTVVAFDVLGQPVCSLDASGRVLRVTRDALHRAVRAFASDGGAAATLLSRTVYGDEAPGAAARNAVGRVVTVYDESGRVDVDGYAFTGAATGATRRYTARLSGLPDWTEVDAAANPAAAAEPLLQPDHWHTFARQDALGRPVSVTLADGTVVTPTFDIGNQLATLNVQTGGTGPVVTLLAGQDHDAAGRPLSVLLGNGLRTAYRYAPDSGRVTSVLTADAAGSPVQDVGIAYDPFGNVTGITDSAQQTRFFANAVVTAERTYRYDALNQLVAATGRELAALGMPDGGDTPVRPLPHVNDTAAVRRYEQRYSLDDLGNITEIQHIAGGNGWRRRFQYAVDLDPADRTNRLAATSAPGDPDGIFSQTYTYDPLGNLRTLPQVSRLDWDPLGRLAGADLGGGGTAAYGYGTGGNRVRKVVDRGGLVVETLYLGGVEVVREWLNGTLDAERRAVHVPGDNGRLAQIDRQTVQSGAPVTVDPVVRWVHGDLLGSVAVTTDESGAPIAYEEYHPYGTTAYRSHRAGEGVSLRRYRFLGRERDEETGLQTLGTRNYSPWLGRWASPDPAGQVDGPNLYRYARNNPATLADPGGMAPHTERIVPATITTPAEFAAWARQAGIAYTGTPVQNKAGDWHVETWTRVAAGAGGPIGPPGDPRATDKPPDAGAGGGAGPDAGSDSSGGLPGTGAGHIGDNETGGAGAGDIGTGQGAGAADEGTGAGTDRAALGPAPEELRQAAQEIARPTSVTGTRPRGTLHLWSGPAGKAEAKAAIARDKSGWMMGDISEEPGVRPGVPTPEHAKAEVEFAHAKASAPGGMLTPEEMDRIWGDPSASVVGRGAFAGHPVEAHGDPAPTSIQVTREWPARRFGGGLSGGLSIGTGMFQALVGGQDPNAGVAIGSVLAGVGETTSGIIYASGALVGATGAMTIGAAGATFFGGAGAAIGFGAASVRAAEQGDTVGALVNGLGAVGGLLLIASLFTPVGWVGLLGLGLVAFASGFNIGRWLASR
ncbi:SpvB/TcaC N-terminal domain-containing protein [Streptomyces stelliscabiei]|uniref:SpvB/TcaC N-terminal domain-containing protein n=1 Tax=Streptomyces stelliscabiei TaxID=146820 RepID=UPI002FEF8426